MLIKRKRHAVPNSEYKDRTESKEEVMNREKQMCSDTHRRCCTRVLFIRRLTRLAISMFS